VESGRLEVLAVAPAEGAEPAPELRVDGTVTPWEPYAPPVLLATVELAPGLHELAVGTQTLRVYVRGEATSADQPTDWGTIRSHADSAAGALACAACHETHEEGGRAAVGPPQEPQACLVCHSADDFAGIHFHPLEPIANCHRCHALHGSTAASLLRAPVKQLCTACHQ